MAWRSFAIAMKTGTPLRASLSRWRFDISELWSARHAELQGENIFLRGLNVGKACAAKLSRIPPMKFMRNRDFKASPGHCNGVIFYQLQYAAAKKKGKAPILYRTPCRAFSIYGQRWRKPPRCGFRRRLGITALQAMLLKTRCETCDKM